MKVPEHNQVTVSSRDAMGICKLSIIITSFNTRALLVDCLESIRRFPARIPYEVLVVDNASRDGSSAAVMSRFPGVKLVVNERNVGFSCANNHGIREASGSHILLLNSDTRVTEGALDELVASALARSDVGAVAPMLQNGDGSFQRSYFRFPNATRVCMNILGLRDVVLKMLGSIILKVLARWSAGVRFYCEDLAPPGERKVPYVLFACVLVPREVFEEVGLLDESFFFYHEDCEFGYRLAKKGKSVWWVPSSKVIHLGGGSSSVVLKEAFREYYRSLLILFKKHKSAVELFVLRACAALSFVAVAVLTVFGYFKWLEIPSTYRRGKEPRMEPFGPRVGRFVFYISMARLFVSGKCGRGGMS